MKILFANHNADLYGANRCLLRMASRLRRDGHTLRVILPADGPFRSALENAGVTVGIQPDLCILDRAVFRSVPKLLAWVARLPRSVARFRRELRSFQPDLVHSNSSVILTAALAARLGGIPHVFHVREFYTEFAGAWPLYRRFLTAFSARLFCVSAAVAAQFPVGRRRAQAVVVHDGFPREEFEGVAAERVEAFCRRFNLDGCRRVGVIGRIKLLRKGQETFLRAAALLKDRFPDVRFLIIGSPFPGNESHLATLQAQAAETGLDGRVVFTGEIEDVRAAYAALDIVVLPSGQPEPFGGVVIEAMAMGKPVVATRAGGSMEQVDDGVTGLLIPPNDPPALARALGELLADGPRRAALGRAGQQRYRTHFELEPIYATTLKLYTSILEPHVPTSA